MVANLGNLNIFVKPPAWRSAVLRSLSLPPRSVVAAVLLLATLVPLRAAEVPVRQAMVDDRKAVIATVEPVHVLQARARIGGTIANLTVREGDRVTAADRIALVVDPKLALQIQALQARISAQQAQLAQAQIDFDRASELRRTGAGSQATLDTARTALDVAQRTLQAQRADQQVVEQQAAEGAVLAPAAGRVLKVPLPEGTVVMPGETVATIATDNYILRLSLPERHARNLAAGDTILIGQRGLEATQAAETLRSGRVVLVYPQIENGRVIADVEVSGLGNYFIGELTRVWISTGKRAALVVPAEAVFRRFGVRYVRLKNGLDVVVQVGELLPGGIEILAGLNPGDIVVTP
jgi:multidrug efflux system membrane fusion protein